MANQRKVYCPQCDENHYGDPCPTPEDIAISSEELRSNWDKERLKERRKINIDNCQI